MTRLIIFCQGSSPWDAVACRRARGAGQGAPSARRRPQARPADRPVRVVIADDEPLIRAGLRAIFEGASGIEVVAVAASRRHRPDVVLADIQIPRLDGLDAARQILAMTPAPKVIMLTTFDLDEYLYQAMRAGASGFLVKDTPATSSRPRSGPSPPETRCRPLRQPAASSNDSSRRPPPHPAGPRKPALRCHHAKPTGGGPSPAD